MQPYQNYNEAEGTMRCPHCHKQIRITFVICPKCCKQIAKAEPVHDSPDGAHYTPIGRGVVKPAGSAMGWSN